MTNEERLDWLCRLRSFLTTVGMPKEWRANFNEALSATIDYEKAIEDVKAEIEEHIQDCQLPQWHDPWWNGRKDGLEDALEIIKHISGKENNNENRS